MWLFFILLFIGSIYSGNHYIIETEDEKPDIKGNIKYQDIDFAYLKVQRMKEERTIKIVQGQGRQTCAMLVSFRKLIKNEEDILLILGKHRNQGSSLRRKRETKSENSTGELRN